MPVSATGRPVLVVDDLERAPLVLADTYGRRLRGMLARRPLPPALLLRPCASVHGAGMTAVLDVAFLTVRPDDTDGTGTAASEPVYEVTRTARLVPFGLVSGPRGTAAVLETPRGGLESLGVRVGGVVRVGRAQP